VHSTSLAWFYHSKLFILGDPTFCNALLFLWSYITILVFLHSRFT
jgi:hypothetical protein